MIRNLLIIATQPKMIHGGTVYILSNTNRSVLYIGVTSDLVVRIQQHQEGVQGSFTTKYNCIYLIYYESFRSIQEAIKREKQLKNWKRDWKDQLIKDFNPNLVDLTPQILKW